jgi:O-antigen/teichoic acid export membrane protein
MAKLINSFLQNSLLKSVGIYTVAGVINGSVVFLLLPFFTSLMTPEEYGMVSMFRTINSFVFPFIAFYASVSRAYFDKDKIDFKAYIGNSVFAILANAIVILTLLILLDDLVFRYTLFPQSYIWTIVVFATGTSIMKMGLGILQVTKKPILYGVLQISSTVLIFLLAIFLVGYLDLNWIGAVYADTFVLAFFAIVVLVYVFREGVKLRINKKYLKDIYMYNIPLILHIIGRGIITMSDKIFITNIEGVAETGLYAAGFQIGLIVFVLSTAFQAAWLPHFYEVLTNNIRGDIIKSVKYIYYYLSLIFLMALLLTISAPLLTKLVLGKDFYDSAKYVGWIAFGFAFNAAYLVFSNVISYQKKTSYLGVITLLGALLNIGLNFVWVGKYGAIGAAKSTLVTFVVISILTFIFGQKCIKLPWLFYKIK